MTQMNTDEELAGAAMQTIPLRYSSFIIRHSVFPYGHSTDSQVSSGNQVPVPQESRGASQVPISDWTMPESTGLICPSQSRS